MKSLVPYERFTKLFDRALELELVEESERRDSDSWGYYSVNDQNYIAAYLENCILIREARLEEKRKEQAEFEARQRKRYDKTFIIDFNERESGINAVWIPPGYRFIQVYYGGCDTCAVDHDDKEIRDEDYCDAAIDLAEHMNLSVWKENYPDVAINPETDIVLACDTQWDRRSEDLYLPPDIKAIWTSKALKKQGKEKIDAAKFLYSKRKENGNDSSNKQLDEETEQLSENEQ